MAKKNLLYFADLTHTGPVISSDVFPYGAGMVAAYLLENFRDEVEVELFKFPSDLARALEERKPDMVGFSNYSWNFYLSYDFTERIKRKYPSTIILFGGPNYGLHTKEIEVFWANHSLIDFYIVGEGEVSTGSLYKKLRSQSFDVSYLKSSGEVLDGCHYLHNGQVVRNALPARVKTLTELPSPYLIGLMDKFWDTCLIPLIATTRGCPFHCTMCAEGAAYYNKVAHNDNFSRELEYIATRVKNTTILNLSDANFGMYKQDVDNARIMAQYQHSHGYPKSLLTATGKNKKENVIEIAALLNGAMVVFASVQSTDEEVLENIKRSNIKIEYLKDIAIASKTKDSNTVTELILALPGDTLEKHKKSLKDTVDAGLGVIRMYQLIMLKQSELNAPNTRDIYKIETRYRVMPRSFGRYQVFGDKFISVEAEEICISTNSMPFPDYLECRELDLAIEILHNGSPFFAYWQLCNWLNYSWFNFLMQVYEQRNRFDPKLMDLFSQFRKDNETGYWTTYVELKANVMSKYDLLINNTDGTNEMSKAKAKAFFLCSDELHSLVREQMRLLLMNKNILDEGLDLYLNELDCFIKCQQKNLLEYEHTYRGVFSFDFIALQQETDGGDPRKHRFNKPVEFEFYFDDDQKAIYGSYINLYGKNSIDALGRLLMRTRMTDMFRRVRLTR